MNQKNTEAIGGKKLSYKDGVKKFYTLSLASNYSFALWRMPLETHPHFIIDLSAEANIWKVDLEEIGQGFVFSSFNNFNNDRALFIQNDIYLGQNNEVSFSSRVSLEMQEKISRMLNEPDLEEKAKSRIAENGHLLKPHESSKEAFKEMVAQAVSQFSDEKFQKVVASRARLIDLPVSFDPVDFFFNLCQEHPGAFVSFVFSPGNGLWIGATPEPLLSVDRNKVFRTAAVAGTQLYHGDKEPIDVAWTQKEIEEQAMVGRYIINCFKKIRLREYEEIGPKTDIAGNLLHLRTDFRVNMAATGFPQLGSVMLDLLHPTSAVAGMPRDKALEFIHQHEKFDRSFFSGYLGPVNVEGETAIFVNLRCAKLLANHAVLYAGAGVTEDSIPEKEWEETELKCDIIGKFIQQD